jgi:hypothetical protein
MALRQQDIEQSVSKNKKNLLVHIRVTPSVSSVSAWYPQTP